MTTQGHPCGRAWGRLVPPSPASCPGPAPAPGSWEAPGPTQPTALPRAHPPHQGAEAGARALAEHPHSPPPNLSFLPPTHGWPAARERQGGPAVGSGTGPTGDVQPQRAAPSLSLMSWGVQEVGGSAQRSIWFDHRPQGHTACSAAVASGVSEHPITRGMQRSRPPPGTLQSCQVQGWTLCLGTLGHQEAMWEEGRPGPPSARGLPSRFMPMARHFW